MEPLVPPAVVTVIDLGPSTATLLLVIVALICVELTTVTPLTDTPFAGANTFTVVPVIVKLLPVRVTAVDVPRNSELGVIELRIGVPGFTTVKVMGLLVPPGVVRVTFLAVRAAPAATANEAVTEVSLTTVTALTVIPPPLTFTAVVPVRPVPVKVTVSLVPLAPVLGVIEDSAPDGTITVNVTALLFPRGVVTFTFLAPPAPPLVGVKVAVTDVSLTTTRLVTATPVTLIAVVPVNPVPVSVTETPTPRFPELGAIEVSSGPVIVNGKVLLAPALVTTLTFTLPRPAPVVLVIVAVIVVAFTRTTLLTETPAVVVVPFARVTVDPVTKFVPVRVTAADVPRASVLGVIEVSAGPPGATTVKVPAFVVPAGTVTVTFRAVSGAFGAMVKVAVTVVALTAAKLLIVIPVAELTLIAVAPVRPLPVIVTLTTVPCAPVVGEMEATVPTPLPFWN
jgi:hypothetical protein